MPAGLEIITAWKLVILIKNVLKVDSAYTSFKQASKISEKNLSKEKVKALNNLV